MHRSILALTLLFFAFGANAATVSCDYRIYRPIPCKFTSGPQYQLTSFNILGQRLDQVNGDFGRRYDRGSIKVLSPGRTFITYRMYGLGPRCGAKDPALSVHMGLGGGQCICTTSPVCQQGKGALGMVFRTEKRGLFRRCVTTQAHCLRVELKCSDSNGCPVNYVSNQYIPSEWSNGRCSVRTCNNPNI